MQPKETAKQGNTSFYDVFVDLLRDIFDAENQLVEAMPKWVKAASHTELKEAFTQHLEETKNQVQRLKKIFKALNENPTGRSCQAMKGLLAEGQEALLTQASAAVKDACLIIAAQKIEHYEIANYGSARAIARHLNDSQTDDRIDFDDIADTLQVSLDEEGDANEKLTDIAEGGFFTTGVNEEAENEQAARKTNTRRTPPNR